MRPPTEPDFPPSALLNLREAGADWRADLNDLRSGAHTPASLLALCLRGAEADRHEGWREYVRALERCNDVTTPAFTRIEYMPVHLRASHIAAGNSGRYPGNGAVREYVRGLIEESALHPEWASIIAERLRLIDIPPQDRGDICEELPAEAMAPVTAEGDE